MTSGRLPHISPSMLDAARTVLADAVAAEVAESFAEAGIDCLLLRGASIARHLYGAGEARVYDDADLMIQTFDRARAEEVLRRLGFRDVTGLGRGATDRPAWSSTWARERDGGNVDLHWTIVGAGAQPQVVWSTLAGETARLELVRTNLAGLNEPATALVVALHAAQHGVAVPRVQEDLQRALSFFQRETWESAARLADEIDSLVAFAFGLRLAPTGVELADELGLPNRPSVETILRSEHAPPTALGFDWLSQTPGLGAKTRLIAEKIVPDPAFMRVWFPPARGGSSLALVLGYLWRPLWLVWHGPAGLRSWLAARRAARGVG